MGEYRYNARPGGQHTTPYGAPVQNRDSVVPDSGYVPPVMPPPSASGPTGPRRAQVLNSADWWRAKARQGAVIFLVLFTPGLILTGLSQTTASRAWLLVPGLAAIGLGAAILAIHLLAPFTLKWIVNVPQNQYWAVEDLRGMTTLGFLGEGPMAMQRKLDVRIVPYANFTSLQVTEIVTNVFDTNDLPVDIEVIALLRFDPTQADPQEYATLRGMIQRRQFEFEIRRQINMIVRTYLSRLDPSRSRSVQDTMSSLEAAITEHLSHLAALGLQPVSARPVSAFIRTPHAIPDHIRRLWTRGTGNMQESEMIRDIKEMMNAFDLSFEDAARHYYLLKHGVQPPAAPGGAASGGPFARRPVSDQTRYGQHSPFGEQTAYHSGTDQTRFGQHPPAHEETVYHSGTDQTRFGQHPPAQEETVYHSGADQTRFSQRPPTSEETVYHTGGIPGEEGAPPDGSVEPGQPHDTDDASGSGGATRRTIRDVDDVPDPFDLRDNPGGSR